MKYTIYYLDGSTEEYEETEDKSTWFNMGVRTDGKTYIIYKNKIFRLDTYYVEDYGDISIGRSLIEMNDWDTVLRMTDCINIGDKIYSFGEKRYGDFELIPLF